MKTCPKIFLAVFLSISLGAAFTNCKKEEDEENSSTSEESEPEDPSEATGTVKVDGCESEDSCGDEMSANLETAGVSINSIQEGMIPGALAIESGSLLDSDPEPDISGCFNDPDVDIGHMACQPVAIQFYIWLARQPLKAAVSILKDTAPHLKAAVKAGKGEQTYKRGDGVEETLTFVADDVNDFQVVTNNKNETQSFKFAGLSDMTVQGYTADNKQYYAAKIAFTDEATWSVDVRTYSTNCDDTPPIAIRLAKKDGVWTGKSMVTMDIEGDCTDDDRGDTTGFFTDFVGDDNYFTGSIYFFPLDTDPTKDSVDVEDYSLANLCTNFEDGLSFCGEQSTIDELAKYPNSYCIEKDTELLSEENYNKACSESSTTAVSAPTYSDQSEWLHPQDDMYDMSGAGFICVPDAAGADACWSF